MHMHHCNAQITCAPHQPRQQYMLYVLSFICMMPQKSCQTRLTKLDTNSIDMCHVRTWPSTVMQVRTCFKEEIFECRMLVSTVKLCMHYVLSLSCELCNQGTKVRLSGILKESWTGLTMQRNFIKQRQAINRLSGRNAAMAYRLHHR